MTDREEERARALDAIVAEAREHLDAPEVDWARLEGRLMDAVERPVATVDADAARRRRLLRAGAAVLVAAAAAVLVARARNDRGVVVPPPVATVATVAPVAPEAPEASALRATERPGVVRVAGTTVHPGQVVRLGDAIEVEGTRALFERTNEVSWLFEQSAPGAPARAVVKAVGGPLVLALANGAIEAQVAPVPTGEAFAVDVATERALVRVAVHGTHLRVERSGDRVVVDLNEGVVAIGVPPPSGITQGTTVTAPAHVELDANDLSTLRIDRAPASVRPPVALGPAREGDGAHAAAEAAHPPPSRPATRDPRPVAQGRPARPKRSLSPEETITSAIRACTAQRGRSGEVHVDVSSLLTLTVSPTGKVTSARFSPPLAPDIQSCAAETIYEVSFDRTGTVEIPVAFSY